MKPASLVLLLVALAFTAFSAEQASAQEYKETYNAALEAAKAKDFAGALELFKEAAIGADNAEDSDIARRARYVAAQLENRLGNAAYKAEQYDVALAHYSSGSDLYAEFIKNGYGEGQALIKIGRIDDGLAELVKVVKAPGDRKTSLAAETAIRQHFYFQASSAVSKSNAISRDADRAITALNQLTQYELAPDADFHYYMAEAHRIKGDAETSLSSADEALGLHQGTRTDKAKIWYVKAQAHVALRQTDAAKEAFTNAAVGAYKQSAEDWISRL